ncbi:hypothetical protein HPP92_001327 [Vanilla planifolia]|uniref:Thioredoxin domain-containing protein n=1 Tax=Vanilla planifolia TaxID=51239 RepID=A0A835S6F3_VANPL|nr:hypothetical protein HPP92_001327 [Vanilla planifolia]
MEEFEIVLLPVAAGYGRLGSLPHFRGLRASARHGNLSSALMLAHCTKSDHRSRVACETQGKTIAVPDVTQETWKSLVLDCDKPVLVEFWASWCEPCRLIDPVVNKLSVTYDGMIRCFKLNTDENPDITTQYEIRSIPTFVMFKNGEKMEKVIGAVPETALVRFIEEFLDR